MGVAENSMRLRMEEAARLVGLRYIINLVSDLRARALRGIRRRRVGSGLLVMSGTESSRGGIGL